MNKRNHLTSSSDAHSPVFASPTTNKLPQLAVATVLALILTIASSATAAQKLWTGTAGDMLWSTAGNWSPAGMPGIGDTVILTNDTLVDLFPFALGGSPDNVVDSLFASPSIDSFGIMNTNGYHNTQLTNLTVVGTSATSVAAVTDDGQPYVFFIGSNQWQDSKDSIVWATIVGNSLTVSNVSANFGVTQISSTAGLHRSILDLTNLNTFTCVVSNVLIGQNFTIPDHAWRPTGELFLAQTNFITTKVICVSDAYQNAGANCYIHLGGVNFINSDEIRLGMHKCIGIIDTASAFGNPSVTFRNAAGTGRHFVWELGDEYDPVIAGFFTSNQARGTMDLTGASVDAQVDHIVLGRGQIQKDATNRTGDGNGTLIFGGGTIDANSIEMGIQVTGPFIGGSVGHGILTINNYPGVGPALMIVRSNIVMAVQQAGAPAPDATGSTGDINVNDGSTLAVAGDIVSGGPGGGTATITLFNGGILDMKPAGDSTPGNVSINILNLFDGVITNYGILSVTNISEQGGNQTFTVYAGQSLAPAGVGTIGTLTMGAGNTLMLRGTTLMDIGKNGDTPINDVIDSSSATVDLGGTLKVSFAGTGALAIGDKFTLFPSAPVNSSPTVILPPPGSGLKWNNNIFVDGSIEVAACGCGESTTPPTLSVVESPTSVTVSWPASYTSFALRAKTNTLSSAWGFVPGVVGNSFTIPRAANSAMFFQLVQQ